MGECGKLPGGQVTSGGEGRTVLRSLLEARFEVSMGVQTGGGGVWAVRVSVGDGLGSGVGGSALSTGAQGFSHYEEGGGGPLPDWGGGREASLEVAMEKGDFRAPSVRVTKDSHRKASLGKPRVGQCRDSAVVFRVDGKKRTSEWRWGVSVLTGHGDGSGSGLPPLRPLVQSDVAGPAPFSQRKEVVLSPPPLRSRHPAPIGQEGTRGATLRPGPRRGGGSQGERAAWGGASQARPRVGRVQSRPGHVGRVGVEGCGWLCGVPGGSST